MTGDGFGSTGPNSLRCSHFSRSTLLDCSRQTTLSTLCGGRRSWRRHQRPAAPDIQASSSNRPGAGELPRIWLFAADTSRCCGRQAVRAHLATEGRTGLRLGTAEWPRPPCARLSVCGVGRRWAGCPATPGVLAESARLENLRLDVIEDRLEAELALGLHAELLPELEALVGNHPFRERLWGHLMLALYRSGRQADALESYQAAARVLANAHGLDPGPGLHQTSSRDPGA